MKTRILKKEGFSIFLNPVTETQLDNGPLVNMTHQLIVYPKKDGGFDIDFEAVDINFIILMGVKIEESDKIRQTIKFYSEMGINLFKVCSEELEEMVKEEIGIYKFVRNQIGIDLNDIEDK